MSAENSQVQEPDQIKPEAAANALNGSDANNKSPTETATLVNKQIKATGQSAVKTIVPNMSVTRERSFIRQSNNQQHNIQQLHHPHPLNQPSQKRRSLGQFNYQHHQPSPQQMRGKPELEIYRPPNVRVDGVQQPLSIANGPGNKLNVHAQEFTMNIPSSPGLFQPGHHHHGPGHLLQLSKSSGNMHQHFNLASANRSHHHLALNSFGGPQHITNHQRAILMNSHNHQHQAKNNGKLNGNAKNATIGMTALPSSQMPLVTSPSSGNILHSTGPRVKFALDTPTTGHGQSVIAKGDQSNGNVNIIAPLQRSKSLSSADAFSRGVAGMGFALGSEAKDIGVFAPEIQTLIDKAAEDPNQLSARNLMELATVALQRAVEARRFALPVSRLCIAIIAKERKETFLEALLNICRQWYQEREKVLGPSPNSKNPSRPRFTAFMAFLTEMFCQLKRRQLQLRTQCDGVPPPLVLLTVLLKSCEDCVKPPVRSLSEIECLFFVLTCIGRDLESHLPDQLDCLLASVRDAFLNSNASAPAIRRTLLQLIELQASHWQLPGNTVLYYYPSSK